MARDFWSDWADTVRDRDFRWGSGVCETNLDVTPLKKVTIMHVAAYDPQVKRLGEISTTPRPRWAPERYVISWRVEPRCRCHERITEPALLVGPHVCAGVPTHRILSYTTVN